MPVQGSWPVDMWCGVVFFYKQLKISVVFLILRCRLYPARLWINKAYFTHSVIHDGLTYPCPICGKLFQWKRNLARHTRNHRERDAGQLHECRACGKSFASRDCYNNHMRLSKRHVPEHAYQWVYKSFIIFSKVLESSWTISKHLETPRAISKFLETVRAHISEYIVYLVPLFITSKFLEPSRSVSKILEITRMIPDWRCDAG